MGFFSKTEQELKEERKLKYLIDQIKDAETNFIIGRAARDYLVDYVESVRKGGFNDFYDNDVLVLIVQRLLSVEFDQVRKMEDHFETLKRMYKKIVPVDSEERIALGIEFAENYAGADGIINKGLYDEGLFATFENKTDYYELMRVIIANETATEEFDVIKEYIKRVSKYCLNQDILKRDIISFISGMENVIDNDYEKYINEELENAKRRIGVYSLSPKALAECDSKLRKMGGYLEQFGIYLTSIQDEKDALTTIIDSGKKDIQGEKDKSIEELKAMIEHQKEVLMERLDNYLKDLEEVLRKKSDNTFREIVETYKSQVEEFRRIFRTYSETANEDFLSIQRATEQSIKQLEEYVTNEPQLQQLLSKAQEQNQVREKIIELVSKEKELLKHTPESTPKKKNEIVLPGYERVMVPYRHMVLPPEVSKKTVPAFDSRIPFEERLKKIKKEIRRREQQGEIFHKKLEEIIIDIMEGDWPYLWGPSGTGKSYMAKQVASILGMPLTKGGKITEPHSVLGYNDPQGRFRITPTFVAALYGHLLSLDEFDNGNPDTQIVLNDIYSESLNKLENPDETCEIIFGTDVEVDVHPNFRMIAAGNTSGAGENSVFSSRGKIDESIQERMTPIYIDYDDRLEERILKKYPEWYKFFIDFRKACIKYSDSNGIEAPQGITTTRDAAAIRKYIEHNSKTVDQVISEKFVQVKDSEYRKALAKTIANMYDMYYEDCPNPSYNGELKDVDSVVLAKKFISACKRGIK